MNPDRRDALRLAGLGVGAALAGCLDLGEGGQGADGPTETPTATPTDPTDGPGPRPTIVDSETMPFALRSSVPPWYHEGDDESGSEGESEEPVGHAVVVDSADRARDVTDQYDLPEDRAEEVRTFLEDVDYETDRVVLVESVGPNGCHDELAIEDVRLEDGRLRADAVVVDNSDEGSACTEALVYPSALLRVSFDGAPVDEVAVDVTDGWGETATVTASADDPLLTRDSGDNGDPGGRSGHVRPESDPDPVAPLECDEDGVRRHGQWYDESDVRWGDVEEDGDHVLSLRVDDLEYEYGDTARITLTNVSSEEVHTGNRAKYNLQVYTEDGWEDVRVMDDDRYWGYTDEAYGHPPGEGFEWTFELTEDGIVEDAYHDDARVCPDLQAGRYRFAYFGVIGDEAVAVSFDLRE